jgi:hypothetical protein
MLVRWLKSSCVTKFIYIHGELQMAK